MASRPLIATVALCAIVLLAGCEGALGDQLGDTPTATPEPDIAAPGLTTAGITDAGRLATAHLDSLQGRSYTVRAVLAIEPRNAAPSYRREAVLRVGAAHQRFRYRQNVRGPFPHELEPRRNFDAWSNGNFTYVRSRTEDRPTYQRFHSDTAPVHADTFTGRSEIANYLGAVNHTSVRQVRRDGWIAYEVTTVGDRFQPYDIEMVVDTFGLVHELTVQYPIETQVGEALLTYRLEYAAVGSTTVDTPIWVPEARANTSVLTARPLCTGDRNSNGQQC